MRRGKILPRSVTYLRNSLRLYSRFFRPAEWEKLDDGNKP